MNKYPIRDTDFEEVLLKEVKPCNGGGYDLTRWDGWSFYCPPTDNVIPKAGMMARFYGKGLGFTVRGLFIDGKKVFYLSKSEQEEKDRQDIIDSHNKQKAEFEKNKVSYFERISKLPDCFQKRIAKFQNTNSDFDWEFGGYELFCCEQAVIIADTLKTKEQLEVFLKMDDWDKQIALVPNLDKGHSGNTFSCAKALARHYIINPDIVILSHGALTPLVGCKEYGCPHPYNIG
jgi:hypothetical protein